MSEVFRQGRFVREAAEPVRAERFSADTQPEQLVKQLSSLQAMAIEATEASRRNRSNAKRTFEDIACGTAGATVVLQHNLGQRARWRVVDWRSTLGGGGVALERALTGNDDNTLTLQSYVAGTATIEVE